MTMYTTRDVGAQAKIPSQVALTATLVLGVATYQLATTMVAPALPLISNTFGMSTVYLGLTQSFFFLVAALRFPRIAGGRSNQVPDGTG